MDLADIDAESFPREVLGAEKLVLVDFWGPRCQPCLTLMPAVEALAQEYEERMKVVKVNASARENLLLCREHNVMGLPAYLFFRDGKEVNRLSGDGITKASLVTAIESILVQ